MINSNVNLRSNVYVLKKDLIDDKQFHAQVRQKSAISQLLKYILEKKSSSEEIELTALQKAILRSDKSYNNQNEAVPGLSERNNADIYQYDVDYAKVIQEGYSQLKQETLNKKSDISGLIYQIAKDGMNENQMLDFLIAIDRISMDINHIGNIIAKLSQEVDNLKSQIRNSIET